MRRLRLRRWLRLASLALRDGLIPFLPQSINRKLLAPADFAFLIHPRDLQDVERRYPAFRRLSPRLQNWILHHPPVVLDRITVRDRLGRHICGYLISISLTAEQMLRKRSLAKEKILQALRLAEALGSRVIGLGALTASVTDSGRWLLGWIQRNMSFALTTGSAYTVAVAHKDIEQLIAHLGLEDPLIAIVGCYGSIGEALTKLLGPKYRLLLIGRAKGRISAFWECIKGYLSRGAMISTRLEDLKEADLIITTTNNPSLKLRAEMLKPGAVVYDLAQPPNTDYPSLWHSNRVLCVDGGLVEAPGVGPRFDFGLPKGVIFACLAETILQALEGDFRHHIGSVSLKHIGLITDWAKRAGFQPALVTRSLKKGSLQIGMSQSIRATELGGQGRFSFATEKTQELSPFC